MCCRDSLHTPECKPKRLKCFLEAEVAAYVTRTIGSVFWRVHCIPLGVWKKTSFLKSLSFFSLNAQVNVLIASIGIILWELIYLLSAVSLLWSKGLTLLADFSLPITPISRPYVPRTSRVPEVAIFGVPNTCEGNIVVQFLNICERAATVILCTR